MPFNFYDTHTLLMAVQQLTPAATFLRDRYFPTNDASDIFATDDVLVEFRDGSKKLAPFVAPRKGGVTVLRAGYNMERYTPPFVAPRRVLTLDELRKRGFGEALYSQLTPEQRQQTLILRDADELGELITNREEAMAAETMLTNGCVMKHIADDVDKAIPVIKQYFGANANNRGFDQQTGKELTQNGISTAVAWGGEWVLWGDHTAAYTYGADVDPRAIFDVSMRMLMHITNSFQREWSPEIDEPMTRALKDRIINREQEKLDGYVSMGALLGEPVILFLESENSTTDVMNGDFRWDIAVTPTPPLKSASVYVAYTDAGFSVYYEGGDE